MTVRELPLFTGAGGGLLGTRLLGWTPIGYVERDDYCQRVIAQRIKDGLLPAAPIFGDVRKFLESGAAREYRGFADVVTAGWPCQPHSNAGKRRGAADEREGWPWVIETIRQVRPCWFLGENVPGILSTDAGRYFAGILRDLAESGYDARWRVLSAAEVGAPHKRDRLWLVAHRAGERKRSIPVRPWRPQQAATNFDRVGADVADADSGRSERTQQQICPRGNVAELGGQSLGNTASAGLSHGRSSQVGRSQPQSQLERPGSDVSDTNGQGYVQPRPIRSESQHASPQSRCNGGQWWATEPGLGRLAHGVPHRVDRLRAAGNGQVPAVAAAAWHLLTTDLLAAEMPTADLSDLAAFWPDLAELPDGVDIFRDRYGALTGKEADDGGEYEDRVDGNTHA